MYVSLLYCDFVPSSKSTPNLHRRSSRAWTSWQLFDGRSLQGIVTASRHGRTDGLVIRYADVALSNPLPTACAKVSPAQLLRFCARLMQAPNPIHPSHRGQAQKTRPSHFLFRPGSGDLCCRCSLLQNWRPTARDSPATATAAAALFSLKFQTTGPFYWYTVR